jgi:nitrous oxide reductase
MDRIRQHKGHLSRRALLRTGAVTSAAAAATAGGLAAASTDSRRYTEVAVT